MQTSSSLTPPALCCLDLPKGSTSADLSVISVHQPVTVGGGGGGGRKKGPSAEVLKAAGLSADSLGTDLSNVPPPVQMMAGGSSGSGW